MNVPLAEPVAYKSKSTASLRFPSPSHREDLVVDVRASLTPAQLVERKLIGLLKSTPLPVSRLLTQRRRSG